MEKPAQARETQPHRTHAVSVVLLGDANTDIVLSVDQLPAPGQDALALRQATGVGGSVANTAILLRRLGLRSTLLSCVGRDYWGDFALAQLGAEGVDTAQVCQHPLEPTSLNVIAVTPDGERTMLAYRGASSRLTPDSIDTEVVAGARALHLSGYALLASPQREAALVALRAARESRVTTCIDVPVPSDEASRRDLQSILADLDVVVVGVPEALAITGRNDAQNAVAALLDRGVGVVALKLGAEGSVVASTSDRALVPAFSVTAIDTTGAGDAFAAGALAATCQGAPLGVIGTLANACGAAAIRNQGAGRSLPSLQDIRDLLLKAAAHGGDSLQRDRAAAALAVVDATAGCDG